MTTFKARVVIHVRIRMINPHTPQGVVLTGSSLGYQQVFWKKKLILIQVKNNLRKSWVSQVNPGFLLQRSSWSQMCWLSCIFKNFQKLNSTYHVSKGLAAAVPALSVSVGVRHTAVVRSVSTGHQGQAGGAQPSVCISIIWETCAHKVLSITHEVLTQ